MKHPIYHSDMWLSLLLEHIRCLPLGFPRELKSNSSMAVQLDASADLYHQRAP